jgi:hypothetical protein
MNLLRGKMSSGACSLVDDVRFPREVDFCFSMRSVYFLMKDDSYFAMKDGLCFAMEDAYQEDFAPSKAEPDHLGQQ